MLGCCLELLVDGFMFHLCLCYGSNGDLLRASLLNVGQPGIEFGEVVCHFVEALGDIDEEALEHGLHLHGGVIVTHGFDLVSKIPGVKV